MGGSAHGVDKGGLTDKGRDMVRRMEAKQMIVDLSHGSDQQIDDVLAMATRPVVVSHTGVRGTCDNRRNLSDEQLRGDRGQWRPGRHRLLGNRRVRQGRGGDRARPSNTRPA